MGAGLRARVKTLEEPPDPNVRAPALDPTCAGRGWVTTPSTATIGFDRTYRRMTFLIKVVSL